MRKKTIDFFLLISIEFFFCVSSFSFITRFESSIFFFAVFLLSSVQKEKIDINFLVFFQTYFVYCIAISHFRYRVSCQLFCFPEQNKEKKKYYCACGEGVGVVDVLKRESE